MTIDTEAFPPEVLLLRSRTTVAEVEGIPAEYAQAAARYLGAAASQEYLAQIDRPAGHADGPNRSETIMGRCARLPDPHAGRAAGLTMRAETPTRPRNFAGPPVDDENAMKEPPAWRARTPTGAPQTHAYPGTSPLRSPTSHRRRIARRLRRG